ncbi:MAG: hypothetical protein AMXMBFR58_35350 [Phycisphaerae bacterium]|nr:hypothetical protein [Phycisphaerales bacterium]
MTLPPEELAQMLDAYLDGRLNEEQSRRLEALAAQDPALAAELEAATAADQSIRRLFAPPEPAALTPEHQAFTAPAPIVFPGHAGSAHSAPTIPAQAPLAAGSTARPDQSGTGTKTRSRTPLWLAIAAVLVIAVGGAIYFNLSSPPESSGRQPKAALTPSQLYANLMAKKFRPAFVCENDEQFAKFLGDRFGSGAVLAQAPTVEILGWDYADGMIGEATAVIMTKVDDQPVVLVVDEKKYDRTLEPPAGGLKMFRDVCNGLVFYEITPLAEPRLLQLLKAAPPLVLRTD